MDLNYFQTARQSLRCGRNLRKIPPFSKGETLFRQTLDSYTNIRHILYSLGAARQPTEHENKS